jgi:poly-beta-1,6-N-acetyl-D-glucosamine synthase
MIFDFFTYFFTTIPRILIVAFAFFALVQLVYYWAVFSRLAFKKHKVYPEVSHPVSVVVCARNEYQNLKDFLPEILDQDYPCFEVILINDDSDDETEFLTRDLQLKYPNFRVVNINRAVSFIKGKKFALSVGIKEAKYDHLLLTDADCKPASSRWIQSMQQGFVNKNSMVLGYGRYEKKGGLLNLFVRFDTVHTAMQYLSFGLAKHPYMGVGRNLSYTKTLFEEQKGFTSHYAIHYGDDDLFVNKASKRNNANVVYCADAQTVSIAPKTWDVWFRQKKRHMDTGKYYRFATKFVLGGYASSALFFYLFFALAAIFAIVNFQLIDVIVIVSLFFIRFISQFIIFAGICKKLNEKRLAWSVPLLDVLFTVLYPIWSFSNLIIPKNKWK